MPSTKITIRVTAGSSREGVGAEVDGALQVRVKAAAVEGAANDAVVQVLAKQLKVPKWAVRIVSGQTSRKKIVEVEGLEANELRRRLSLGSRDHDE